jgi:hypothetical protein
MSARPKGAFALFLASASALARNRPQSWGVSTPPAQRFLEPMAKPLSYPGGYL